VMGLGDVVLGMKSGWLERKTQPPPLNQRQLESNLIRSIILRKLGGLVIKGPRIGNKTENTRA